MAAAPSDDWTIASITGNWETYAKNASRCYGLPTLFSLLLSDEVLPLLKEGWKVWDLMVRSEESSIGGGWGLLDKGGIPEVESRAYLIPIADDPKKRDLVLVHHLTTLGKAGIKLESFPTVASSNPFAAFASASDEDDNEKEE